MVRKERERAGGGSEGGDEGWGVKRARLRKEETSGGGGRVRKEREMLEGRRLE